MPAHAEHFKRINATPSDLPSMSNGFATYPVPAQLGQSFELKPSPPSVEEIFHDQLTKFPTDHLALRITNKKCSADVGIGVKELMRARKGHANTFRCRVLFLRVTLPSVPEDWPLAT